MLQQIKRKDTASDFKNDFRFELECAAFQAGKSNSPAVSIRMENPLAAMSHLLARCIARITSEHTDQLTNLSTLELAARPVPVTCTALSHALSWRVTQAIQSLQYFCVNCRNGSDCSLSSV